MRGCALREDHAREYISVAGVAFVAFAWCGALRSFCRVCVSFDLRGVCCVSACVAGACRDHAGNGVDNGDALTDSESGYIDENEGRLYVFSLTYL